MEIDIYNHIDYSFGKKAHVFIVTITCLGKFLLIYEAEFDIDRERFTNLSNEFAKDIMRTMAHDLF